MITQKEKELLRELAQKYKALAELPVNGERRERMRATNDLKTGIRPSVWIHEIPWHEMDIDGELKLVCEDEFAREMEWYFRTSLYRWKYIQVDTVLPMFYPIYKAFSSTGNGLTADEDIVRQDEKNNIVSHHYNDMLETEEQLEQLHTPILTAYPEKDQRSASMAEEILGGILPVRLMGHQIYYAPWDEIPRFRGVEPILIDMYERPEFLHKIISKFASNEDSVLSQMEKLNLLGNDLLDLHCTPAYTSDLPPLEADGRVRLKNVWFRAMAQMFNTVSPAMHNEFEMEYMRPLMAKCGLVYYGCCEPLDNKIELLKTIPNMRKIGVSPWANVESCAEQIGSRYVAARKPNPANVAICCDETVIEQEIEETVKACIKNNCPYEFVLKDISTVSYKPENLIVWAKTVTKVLDRYYA